MFVESHYGPVSFSLLSSANQKNRLSPMAEVDKRTNGFRRRAESIRKAPDVLKELVTQAHDSGISADYLLFDSWFAFPSTIIGLLEQKQQVICMLKAAKTSYDALVVHATIVFARYIMLELARRSTNDPRTPASS